MDTKYHEDELVWLKPFEDQPRESAIIEGYEPDIDTYVVRVLEPSGEMDDGLREITPDQIEGRC